ncbi:hypothetical protein IHV09_09435 [Fictibacillus sp. 23RED33]|uniref:hypothetical protein n=1 Tax=Fictibacillus sp. 23RED33 TaxID=2745879 RepID=UPI0018CD02DA|nr:hypothetical protein [Fictibacillus sp. 23RED33]MBH0173781.1 hypothetical protein [Fictibacillus sp. 23RED33]
MSKKAFKVASAAAVAASAFVAVNPAQAATAAEAEVLVKKAESLGGTLKWAISVEGSWDGHSNPDMKLFNDTKAAHAKAVVAVSTLKGAQKTALEARLNDKVKLYVDRAVTLIDAVSAGMKIEEKKEVLESKLETEKVDQSTVDAYHNLSKELRKQEVLLNRVYGQSSREYIREYYQDSAEKVLKDALYPVSVYVELERLDAAITAKNETEANKRYDNIATWLPLVANATMKSDLTAKFESKKSAYEALKTPKVDSVKAINATQVEVKFNKVLDGSDFDTQVEAAGIFKLTNETVVSADLAADGKTVTVTFNGSVEDTDDEFIVEPVMTTAKDANNQPVRTLKHVQVFTYTDTTKAELVSVTSKSKSNTATSVTVVASEPINFAVAKLNGSYVNINFGGTDTATITGLNLDATKEHTLELINLTDKASNPNVTVSTSKKFNVTVDASAPVVSSVTTASEKEILLTFSKRMDEATLEAAFATGLGSGLVKDETLSNLQLGTYAGGTGYVKEVAGSNGTQFKVSVSASLFSNKTSRNLTVLLPDTITDSLGNKLSVTTQSITLTKDTTKPVATGYRLVKDAQGNVTHVEVDFSEGLTAATPALPTIVNENGVAVPAASFLGGLTAQATTAGDTKVVYAATSPAKVAGKFAFSFGSSLVSDLAETANRSDAFNYTIDFGTSTATFNLTSAAATSPTSNQIAVNFGTAVRGGAVSNSATDLNSYTLAGRPLPAGTTITLNAAQTVATIVLPAGSITTTDATAVFTVANVDSLTGAKLNAYNGTVAISDNVKPVLNSGSLTADNKLAVGFSETVSSLTIGDLVIKINGSTVAQTGTSALTVTAGAGSDTGKYLVNLDDLVIQGNAAVMGAGPDTILGTADDVVTTAATETFVDINNNGTFESGTDVKIGDGPVSSFKFSSSALISGVTVSTLATGPSAAQDAATNKLVNGTVITVK